ncbi:hypothetical protein DNTS_025417 [Danionella cerebrum]|uniref:SH2 domain-containing protein n=1 Tax=Danionella cerebrum TaxID=2873325 RepID=A0A553Q302_9TELE|nr:hypothetical protein DNTS_025417 [Danionella translucida]
MGNVMRPKNADPEKQSFNMFRDCDSLVVLADYPCQNISEPIYKKGDRLKGLSEEGCWWKVRTLQTGIENYIPCNHVAKVYHGWLFEGVSRQKAEELLALPGNTTGSFLIRESPRDRGEYSLSVRHRTVKHYKIFRLTNSWYYISPRLTFQCLEDMVNHYSDSSDGICCVLSAPCLALATPSPSSLQDVSPVVMRRNLDWKKDKKSLLMNPSELESMGYRESTMSYGVRSSIAAYLSLASTCESDDAKGRKKKSKSVYVMPDHSCMELDEA